jgi:hypothetical protein
MGVTESFISIAGAVCGEAGEVQSDPVASEWVECINCSFIFGLMASLQFVHYAHKVVFSAIVIQHRVGSVR